MKRGTITHPKTKRLARVLGIPLLHAVGVLESLWHWTAQYAPTGDVSKMAQDLEDGVFWDGKEGVLIPALIQCELLDQYQGKIFVHDWAEHCDATVRRYLERHNLQPVTTLSECCLDKTLTLSRLARGIGIGIGIGNGKAVEKGVQGGEKVAEFDVFYGAYPHHVGKTKALAAFVAARKRAGQEIIMAGVERAKAQWTAEGTEARFIPHPATWLNEGRWEDEADPVVHSPNEEGHLCDGIPDPTLTPGWIEKAETMLQEAGRTEQ